jgi:hypothetical protein
MTSTALWGVAVTGRAAWAVGVDGVMCAHSYLERWNGTAWKIAHVRIPRLGPGWTLAAVTAPDARSMWAVGNTGFDYPLILRWNGTTWRRSPSPPA